MNLGSYRLLSQRGAGRDGISYRAETDAAEPVEVRVLSAAHADAERWRGLHRRLCAATLLEHPAALAVRKLAVDNDPPFIAIEWNEDKTLAEMVAAGLALPPLEALALVRDLASVLAAAHRLGLAHGDLRAETIRGGGATGLKLDFTGHDTISAGSERGCVSAPSANADPAADIFALGRLLYWLLAGRPLSQSNPDAGQRPELRAALANLESGLAQFIPELLHEMLAAEPVERPSALDVERRLAAVLAPVAATAVVGITDAAGATQEGFALHAAPEGVPSLFPGADGGDRLGRFRLLEKLGQGGMGAVYRAEDISDGTIVAIKTIRPDLAGGAQPLRRFRKEARLLAEINNAYITNLLEVNEDAGVHYLVIEFVEGPHLGKLLDQRGKLDERTALTIAADVARGLAAAHEQGIVHRDVKPENILVSGVVSGEDKSDHSPLITHHSPRVKLSDFGLARHIFETDSLHVTQSGAMVGTPLYMAPEQCMGKPIDARADVYGLGATLYHMLAGRPPFVGDTSIAVVTQHCSDPPPPLQKFNPAVSDAVCQVIGKTLAKTPEARYACAGDMLRDLERLLRGEPTGITVHPRLPAATPGSVLEYDWTWEFDSPPARLWPYVANTERINRAVGLPPVQFTAQPAPGGGMRRFGRFRKAGLSAAWEEHPFEWVEERRFGVLREYSQGPFKWLMSLVEMAPRGTGTTLTHRVRLEPRGLLGRGIAAVEVGLRGRRAVERVYRRIDAVLAGKVSGRTHDPFEEPAPLSGSQRHRLARLTHRLMERGLEPALVEVLGDFLAQAPDQEVARIRPLALARRLALDPEQTVAACLHGARDGLLVLLWDILCPICRIPSEVQDSLRQLRDHGRCDVCNIDFELDFANSVEMIFRVHPEVRASELRTYCVGGPGHSPHVAAQVRISPGERCALELALPAGAYRLRGPQLPYVLDFRVDPGARFRAWELPLSRGPEANLPRALAPGGQVLTLTNDQAHELLVRVERTAPRSDALTAARAATLALFRELFPGEVLAPGQLVSVATMTFLVTDLDQPGDLYRELGDAPAFNLLHMYYRAVADQVARQGGAVVKTLGERVLASFAEPVAAVRAGLELPALLVGAETPRSLSLRAAIHRGPAMAATLNRQLDYFGNTVNHTLQLVRRARGGELLVTQPVAGDLTVAALLSSRGAHGDILPDEADGPVQRLPLRSAF